MSHAIWALLLCSFTISIVASQHCELEWWSEHITIQIDANRQFVFAACTESLQCGYLNQGPVAVCLVDRAHNMNISCGTFTQRQYFWTFNDLNLTFNDGDWVSPGVAVQSQSNINGGLKRTTVVHLRCVPYVVPLQIWPAKTLESPLGTYHFEGVYHGKCTRPSSMPQLPPEDSEDKAFFAGGEVEEEGLQTTPESQKFQTFLSFTTGGIILLTLIVAFFLVRRSLSTSYPAQELPTADPKLEKNSTATLPPPTFTNAQGERVDQQQPCVIRMGSCSVVVGN